MPFLEQIFTDCQEQESERELKCEKCGFLFSNEDEYEQDDFISVEETGLCTECLN